MTVSHISTETLPGTQKSLYGGTASAANSSSGRQGQGLAKGKKGVLILPG